MTTMPAGIQLERDPLEFTNWRDTGCDLNPACLTCPFARCRYDEPPRLEQTTRLRSRNARILELTRSGRTAADVSREMNISTRTIERVRQAMRGRA